MFSERRSGLDTRTESDKQTLGERRSGVDRRLPEVSTGRMPSNEQLAQFARRLKRAMSDEKSRNCFGVSCGEGEFTAYPDVARLVSWINILTNTLESEQEGVRLSKITLRKVAPEAT